MLLRKNVLIQIINSEIMIKISIFKNTFKPL